MLSTKDYLELYSSPKFNGALKKKLRSNHSQIDMQLMDDLLQVVFLRAWKYRKSFNSEKSVASSWVLGIASNLRSEYCNRRSLIATNMSSDLQGIVTVQGQNQFMRYLSESDGFEEIVDLHTAVPPNQYIAGMHLRVKEARLAAGIKSRKTPLRMAKCHPEEKHYAKDLCRDCYATVKRTGKL